jgi:hypothetical protein
LLSQANNMKRKLPAGTFNSDGIASPEGVITDSNPRDTVEKVENDQSTVEVINSLDDAERCQVCLDGEVYEDNDIVFCDVCLVPVHQQCYGLEEVPEGRW